MQQNAFQPAVTSRGFHVSIPDTSSATAPFQVPLNLSADEIREMVRDVLG